MALTSTDLVEELRHNAPVIFDRGRWFVGLDPVYAEHAAYLVGDQAFRINAAREQLEDGEPAAALKTLTTVYAGSVPPTRLDRALIRASLAESRVKKLEARIEKLGQILVGCQISPSARAEEALSILSAALTDEKGTE